MGMSSTTYKLDTELIRTNLVERLKERTNCTITFVDFLKDTNSKPGFYTFPEPFKPFDAEEIISSLMDVENLVSIYDLGIVFDWLRDLENTVYLWNKITEYKFSYADYGFLELYDLLASDKCWVYVNQQAEYEDFYNVNYRTRDGCFSLYPNNYYRNYLDYLQSLLAKICLDKEYKNHRDHSSNEELVSYLNTHQTDRLLDGQTESALVNIRKENQTYDIDSNYEFGRSRGYSHYIVAEEMFYQIRDVKKALGDYTGKIFNDFVY
jgi:hypothetical protein